MVMSGKRYSLLNFVLAPQRRWPLTMDEATHEMLNRASNNTCFQLGHRMNVSWRTASPRRQILRGSPTTIHDDVVVSRPLAPPLPPKSSPQHRSMIGRCTHGFWNTCVHSTCRRPCTQRTETRTRWLSSSKPFACSLSAHCCAERPLAQRMQQIKTTVDENIT